MRKCFRCGIKFVPDHARDIWCSESCHQAELTKEMSKKKLPKHRLTAIEPETPTPAYIDFIARLSEANGRPVKFSKAKPVG